VRLLAGPGLPAEPARRSLGALMNRRGFLRAVGAAGVLLFGLRPSAAGAGVADRLKVRLRQALRERRVVTFRYHGHTRRVEPHALGTVSKERPALLGWQVSGGSKSEPPPGWRTFVVEEMTGLRLTRTQFRPRADYRHEGGGLKTVEAEVEAGGSPQP
jgi:hypothetical protein